MVQTTAGVDTEAEDGAEDVVKKEEEEGRKLSYKVITEETGLSEGVLVRLMNSNFERVETPTLNTLCRYFRASPNNGHHQTGRVGPVRANNRSQRTLFDHRISGRASPGTLRGNRLGGLDIYDQLEPCRRLNGKVSRIGSLATRALRLKGQKSNVHNVLNLHLGHNLDCPGLLHKPPVTSHRRNQIVSTATPAWRKNLVQ